ncbi:CYC1, partial [Symbiodinium sp. CCMP2456]
SQRLQAKMAAVGPPCIRAVLAGAGVAMMGEAPVVNAVLQLTQKQPSEVRLLYLGTATYDIASFRQKQTGAFADRGVVVNTLDVACRTPTPAVVEEAINGADIILVSGGNTLFAVDRWHKAAMVEPLRRAMGRGAVLCGGSAGAGCWFDALHSDSMDPDWYRDIMLAGKGAAAEKAPGLLCPHHDRVQSNGVLRSTDFAEMLRRHPGETGLAIDHFAALVLCNAEYQVLTLPDKPGSLMPDGTNQPGQGVPGVWLKSVAADGVIQEEALPKQGPTVALLHPARAIVEDVRVEKVRAANPSQQDILNAVQDEYFNRYLDQLGIAPTAANKAQMLKFRPMDDCEVHSMWADDTSSGLASALRIAPPLRHRVGYEDEEPLDRAIIAHLYGEADDIPVEPPNVPG